MEDQTAFGQDVGLDLECDWGLAVHWFEGENWRLAEREDCFQARREKFLTLYFMPWLLATSSSAQWMQWACEEESL